MAKIKEDNMTAINFRCNAELKNNLEILRFATQAENISVLLIGLCEKFVEVNAPLIQSIEDTRQAAQVKYPSFDAVARIKKKTTTKPSNPAPTADDNPPPVDDVAPVEGSNLNAEQ